MISGEVDQGEKMPVPVTEFEAVDEACGCEYLHVESVRSRLPRAPVAARSPHLAGALGQGSLGAEETIIQVIVTRRRRVGAGQLEVQLELAMPRLGAAFISWFQMAGFAH
jgi:hypothetical protein